MRWLALAWLAAAAPAAEDLPARRLLERYGRMLGEYESTKDLKEFFDRGGVTLTLEDRAPGDLHEGAVDPLSPRAITLLREPFVLRRDAFGAAHAMIERGLGPQEAFEAAAVLSFPLFVHELRHAADEVRVRECSGELELSNRVEKEERAANAVGRLVDEMRLRHPHWYKAGRDAAAFAPGRTAWRPDKRAWTGWHAAEQRRRVLPAYPQLRARLGQDRLARAAFLDVERALLRTAARRDARARDGILARVTPDEFAALAGMVEDWDELAASSAARRLAGLINRHNRAIAADPGRWEALEGCWRALAAEDAEAWTARDFGPLEADMARDAAEFEATAGWAPALGFLESWAVLPKDRRERWRPFIGRALAGFYEELRASFTPERRSLVALERLAEALGKDPRTELSGPYAAMARAALAEAERDGGRDALAEAGYYGRLAGVDVSTETARILARRAAEAADARLALGSPGLVSARSRSSGTER